MKNQNLFVSVDEKALETVSGGLADIGNGSLNGNRINVLSGLSVNVSTGDIGSQILNIANALSCGGCCASDPCAPCPPVC
jgi:hypothetical protein